MLKYCHGPVTAQVHIHDSIPIYQARIDTIEKKVVKWRDQKAEIHYRTIFDSTATKDTVYVELLKADTVVHIDNHIIAGQDTIIAYKDHIIKFQLDSITVLNRSLNKEKRKVILWKVCAGIAAMANIFH